MMKKFNPSSLPYIAACAQTVQFAHAGYVLMSWPGIVIGGIIGAVVSFSIAYAGSHIASLTGQKREQWANTASFVLLALSPIALIAPSYISFGAIALPFWRWVTAGAWAMSPDLSIFLAAIVTGKGMVAKDEPVKADKKPTVKSTKPAFVCSCGYEAKSQAALNGHQLKHKRITGYKVSFEPVKADKERE